MIEILQKGMLTTVQDAGRRGRQSSGVPVCGAMDLHALSIANLLAGNEPHEAALEITGMGPEVMFTLGNIFAVSGGDFDMWLDSAPIEMNRAYFAPAGSVLRVGGAKRGFRAYLAFCGGLDLPPVLGSRSTYMTGGFGGLDGRALEAGDKLGQRCPQTWLPGLERRRAPLDFEPHARVRVILGPQDGYFSGAGMETFLNSEYIISSDSNRMGYRTSGPEIGFAEGFGPNIISDGVAMGAIQVPNGKPIILMADRQTVGGYAKIAHVISVDLPIIAQMRPGDTIRFDAVDMIEAHRLLQDRERKLRNLEFELNHSFWAWEGKSLCPPTKI